MITYQKTSLKQPLKKTFGRTKENPDSKEYMWFLLIKLLTLCSYWSNQKDKLIATVKFFLLA